MTPKRGSLRFAVDAYIGADLVQHIWKRVSLPEGPWGDAGLATAIYFCASHCYSPTDNGERPRFMPPYHLTLTSSGTLRVRLGLFDPALSKVDKDMAKAAKSLHELDGRNPMQVVMQRDERNFILGLIRGAGVSPASSPGVPPGYSRA